MRFFDLTSSHQDLNVDVLDTLESWMTLDHSEKSGAVFQVCVWLKVRKSFSAFNKESEEGSRNTLAMVQRLLARILEAGSKKTSWGINLCC